MRTLNRASHLPRRATRRYSQTLSPSSRASFLPSGRRLLVSPLVPWRLCRTLSLVIMALKYPRRSTSPSRLHPVTLNPSRARSAANVVEAVGRTPTRRTLRSRMLSPTTRGRKTSLMSWRARKMLTSRLKKPPIGGLLVRCQVLDNPFPHATPSSTDDHVVAAVFPRNLGLISPLNPTNHVPHPRGQRSQLATRRPATRHGPPIIAPIDHAIVLVSPCYLAAQTFGRGEGPGLFLHFSSLLHLPTTGPRREHKRKVVAHRALHTTPHQFTSLLKTAMNRSDVWKSLNLKGLSKKLREDSVGLLSAGPSA